MAITPLFLLTLVILFNVIKTESRFHVIKQWNYINFTWPDEEIFKNSIANGLYIPENNIIAGVKYYRNYYYITLPRMKNGVPATLTRIKSDNTSPSPALEPFPNWQMNTLANNDCNSLQNVQNIEIDTKGQMWIIDGGRIDTLMVNPIGKCQPKLIIYDIENNRTNTIYEFRNDVAGKDDSFLYDLVIDNTDGGYAYITDNSANDPGIIVYSVRDKKSWKIRNVKTMFADPIATNFHVNNIRISSAINIAGIALGPKLRTSSSNQPLIVGGEERQVYFSPLSSLHLYSINTTILRNPNQQTKYLPDGMIENLGLKASQTVGMIMDNRGVLYYGLLGNNAISRWDSQVTTFQSGQKIIARDDKYIEWPNSFTFDLAGNLTLIMNRLNKFIYDKLDLNEANFRLISANVGGKSYLYDNNFDYNHFDMMSTGMKPETFSTETASHFMSTSSPNSYPQNSTVQSSAAMPNFREPSTTIASRINRFKASSAGKLLIVNLIYFITFVVILL